MAEDLTLESESIARLLDRHDDDTAALRALVEDGWLDVERTRDGGWPAATVVARCVALVGERGRSMGVAPHIAVAALAEELGVELPGLGAVVTDVRAGVGAAVATGRFWGDPSATTVVAEVPGGGLAVLDLSSVEVIAGDDLLAEAGVQRAIIAAVPAAAVVDDPAAAARHRDRLALLLAVEAAHALRHTVDRTVRHLQQRRQFGAPLASFQALQHRAVDMYGCALLATQLADAGVTAWTRAPDAAGAWAAKHYVGDRGVWAAEQAIQLHGGIGFTWELGIHHTLRRAQRARLLLGGQAESARRTLDYSVAERTMPVTDWTC